MKATENGEACGRGLAGAATIEAAPAAIVNYDPFVPLLNMPGGFSRLPVSAGNQRMRRSVILATIRRLLTVHGFEGVTVRRIAETSGYAVQTIYNLVGPRDRAIVEAIGEYTRFVGRTAAPRANDPDAVIRIVDCWLRSIVAQPDFCRQVGLIFFTASRDVYYAFRDQQMRGMRHLLAQQQRCGLLKPDLDIAALAQQLVMMTSSVCMEWADRPYPLDRLHGRLSGGCANLLADNMMPPHRIGPVPITRFQ